VGTGAFSLVGPLPPPSRQRGRYPRPETPSIDRCSRGPAFTGTVMEGARHRLAVLPPTKRLPTLFRSSALSLGRARREDSTRALHSRGAYRRAPPDDFCNRIRPAITTAGSPGPRAPPMRSPAMAAVFRIRPGPLETRDRGRSGVRVAMHRSTASRGLTGQGPRRGLVSPRFGASRCDRSRTRALPQPDRLGHLLSRR
jgi:hypothetical protein